MTAGVIQRPMTLKELARELGFSERKVQHWRAKGLPFHRVGERSIIYFLDEVTAWLRKMPGAVRSDHPGRRGSGSLRSVKGS